MCGRYVLQRGAAELAEHFGAAGPLPNLAPDWNLAPTKTGAVLRRHPETGERRLDLLRWGLVPRWARDASGVARLINARAEGVAEKPSFRDAFARRRCLAPMDGYYEWLPAEGARGPRQPFAAAAADGSPLAMAGLWEGWRDPATGAWLRTYAVVTTEAAGRQALLHHRSPVVLPRPAWPLWLGEEEAGREALLGLLRPGEPVPLAFWPVSPRVNKVSENDAGLIAHDRSARGPPGLDDPSPYEPR